MNLEGVHHVTAITADGQSNADFYVDVLGLRLVKKTVNQDDPTAYHLFYADEDASAGADITFFEYRGATPGRAGDGMVNRVIWRVGSAESISFWAARLNSRGVELSATDDGRLLFADPEGLGHELLVDDTDDPSLAARHPEIDPEHALRGFGGVRAFASDPTASADLLEGLGFSGGPEEWETRGEKRGGAYIFEEPPEGRGVPGAGTVHHVAWAGELGQEEAWRERVIEAGGRPTEVIDRFYFRSIYFREPSGVLFEIATLGPGFTVDEPAESLGQKISLPPDYEHLRERVEAELVPIVDPRSRHEA
ncbi:MAG TPA: VOC family protein [Solirubrobacterales bacterium]|nr:VOC family protein [Solirubrobacterales bacterium]